MRRLVADAVAGFFAFQEFGFLSAAAHEHGMAAGVLLLFFTMLANDLFGAWWNGH